MPRTKPTLTVESAPIADLHLHPKNPREGDIGAIAVSLEQNGQFAPIIVNRRTPEKGWADDVPRPVVVSGNHTLQAAAALGWTRIDVVYVDKTEKEETRILLAANRTADLATYNLVALGEVLAGLAADDPDDLLGSGYDGSDVDDLNAQLEEYELVDDDGWDAAEGWRPDKDLSEFGAGYTSHAIRSILLQYEGDEYRWMADRLAELRVRYGVEDNAAAVRRLVEDAISA